MTESMAETTNAQSLQDQLDNIKKIIDRGLFTMFIMGALGATLLSIFIAINSSVNGGIGGAIFSTFGVLCFVYVRTAKEKYEKLLAQCKQLQQIHSNSQ
jgi:uncharacterized membrane protein (DUF485 family)